MGIRNTITNWTKENKRLLVAIIFMLIAIAVATLNNYAYTVGFGPIKTPFQEKLNISPDLESVLFAIIIYMGSIVRNRKDMFKSPLRTIMCVLNILFIACFSNTFLNKKFDLFGFGNAYSLIMLATVLSWLGIKAISGYAWIVLLIGAASQLPKTSEAMGIWGAVFLICAFISVGNQLLSGFLVVDTKELKAEIFGGKSTISENIKASIDVTKDVINSAKNMTTQKITEELNKQ